MNLQEYKETTKKRITEHKFEYWDRYELYAFIEQIIDEVHEMGYESGFNTPNPRLNTKILLDSLEDTEASSL